MRARAISSVCFPIMLGAAWLAVVPEPAAAQQATRPGQTNVETPAGIPGAAKTDADIDIVSIIRRSVRRDAESYELLSRYTYQEVDTQRRYEKDGSVDSSQSETFEVVMLPGGPYQRLVARNGRPLSAKDERKETEKLDKEIRKRNKDPEKERAKYQKDRAEQREFLLELPDAFNFKLLGVESVKGRPAWKVFAEPREGFKPKHSRADTFKKVRGTLWIDQSDLAWVRAELEVTETISWGWFVLRIDPGGTIRFEQIRVNDEIWLPSKINIRADARLALLKKIRAEFDIAYSDYRKFESESEIVEIEELAEEE